MKFLPLLLLILSSSVYAQVDPEHQYPGPYNQYNCVFNQRGEDGANDWKVCHTTHNEYQMTVWVFKGNNLRYTCQHRLQYTYVNGVRHIWSNPVCN